MKQFKLTHLLPSVIVALGIIAASFVINFGIGWPMFVGPVLLGIAIVVACIVDTRLHANEPATSVFVRLVVGAMLMVSVLLFINDPTRLQQMVPILGIVAWVSLLQRSSPTRVPD